LVYSQQAATTAGCRVDGSGGPPAAPCVNLSAVERAADLAPALRTFSDPAERAPGGTAIVNQLNADKPPIDPMSRLAGVPMAAITVRRQPTLLTLNERLRARPGLTDVPLLNAAELTAIKPGVIVRTPADFRRQVLMIAVLFILSFWATHGVRAWFGTTGDPIL